MFSKLQDEGRIVWLSRMELAKVNFLEFSYTEKNRKNIHIIIISV